MKKGELFTLLFGIVLATAGVFMFNIGQKPDGAKAVTNYSSEWQATQLYRLKTNVGPTNLGAIGVAEWSVTGVVGTANFTETWKAPDPSGLRIDNQGNATDINGNCDTRNAGAVPYDQSKWLLGCLTLDGAGYGTYEWSIDKATPNSVFSDSSYTSGGAAKCIPGLNTGCVITMGAYGFGYYTMGGSFNNFGQLRMGGLFMPLQWSVTGQIN